MQQPSATSPAITGKSPWIIAHLHAVDDLAHILNATRLHVLPDELVPGGVAFAFWCRSKPQSLQWPTALDAVAISLGF